MEIYSYKISAIICTYNRDKYLPRSLASFAMQTIDKNLFELIIIDNNSTDNTASVSNKFIAANPSLHIKYFFEPNKGLSFARNRGLAEANSPIISYVDDDAILPPEFLQEMVEFFSKHPTAAGVGGKVIPEYENGSEPKWMSKYLNGFVGKVDYGSTSKPFDKTMKYPAGCNMTYKKEILNRAGGFNNELTFRSDDKYIFYAVKNLDAEIWYVAETYVDHIIDASRLDFNNFKKLYLKTGNEEKIRLKHEGGQSGVLKQGIMYVVKLAASIALYALFIIKGERIKGTYIVLSQWFTLKGFLLKNVFVR